MKTVQTAVLIEGRGSVLGPDTNRRVRWWELYLDCGHITERTARYAARTDGRRPGAPRKLSDVLAAPRRAKCSACDAGERVTT